MAKLVIEITFILYRVKKQSVTIQSLTMNMMPLSSVLVVLDLEQHSVFPRLDSGQLVSQSCSQPDHTLLLLKVVLMQLLVICIRMTGGGTSMTQSREVIGSEIRMPFII